MVNDFLKKHYLQIIGIVVGGLGGFLYYHKIGCSSGTCPITSNPYFSILWGALFGYLVFDLFKKKKKENDGSN